MSFEKLDPNQATKFDAGKRMAVSPLRAKMVIDDVATYGTRKYDLGNWHRGKSFTWGRLLDAAYRHIQAFELGEDIDPESGLPHLAHAGWCIQACLELQLTKHGVDDRRIRQYFPPSAGDSVTPFEDPAKVTLKDASTVQPSLVLDPEKFLHGGPSPEIPMNRPAPQDKFDQAVDPHVGDVREPIWSDKHTGEPVVEAPDAPHLHKEAGPPKDQPPAKMPNTNLDDEIPF